MPVLRIVIADDHPIVRVGIKAFLAEHSIRFTLAGEASSGDELLSLLSATPGVDVVITDFAMDEGRQDGLRLLRRLQQQHPGIRIVVLTMLTNGALLNSIQKAGVDCIVGKRDVHKNLASAIENAVNHRPFLSPDLKALLDAANRLSSSPSADHASRLSPRQAETLRLLRSGLTVSEIAASLNRSKKTISAQKQGAMAKLGLQNDAQLFEYLHSSFER